MKPHLRFHRLSSVLLALFSLSGSAVWCRAQDTLIDQSAQFDLLDPLVIMSFPAFSIKVNAPIGQEFVPSFGALDFVDFYTGYADAPGTVGSLAVVIHAGGITGPVIGRSSDVSLREPFNGVTRFAFGGPVSLNAGSMYTAEIQALPGSANWALAGSPDGDIYPLGSLIVQGIPANTDAWFREGLTVPEPSAYALGILGALVWASAGLRQGLQARANQSCQPTPDGALRAAPAPPARRGCTHRWA